MDFILAKLYHQIEEAKNLSKDELEFAETILSLYQKGLIKVLISEETGELVYTSKI